MRPQPLLLYLVLALLAQVGARPPHPKTASAPSASQASASTRDLYSLIAAGRAEFRVQRFTRAAQMFLHGYRESQRRNLPDFAARFLNNLGGCRFAVFDYRGAMQSYLEARGLAERARDREMAGGLALNISSLYLQMGDAEAAARAASAGLDHLRGAGRAAFADQVLLQLGKIRARQGDAAGACRFYCSAIAESEFHGDMPRAAQGWTLLGAELAARGRNAEADDALARALWIRTSSRDADLPQTFAALARLRLAEGDPAAARRMLDRALAGAANRPARLPAWHALRGRISLAGGDLEQGVADFRAALVLARRWRLAALPSDALRVSLEIDLDGLYSDFIDAANTLYLANGRAALVREAFEAAEENRGCSLRAHLARPPSGLPPPELGEALARLRAAEARAFSGATPDANAEVARLRHAVDELELATGLRYRDEPEPGLALGALQRRLAPDDVYLAFRAGASRSWLWVVTRHNLRVHGLPSRGTLASAAAAFIRAVRDASPTTHAAGRRLFTILFANLDPALLAKPNWILAPDGPLYRVPFAALPDGDRFLVERHTLRISVGARLLGRGRNSAPPAPLQQTFVGIGDPVYNAADPRRSPLAPAVHSGLPRLPASAREIRSCAAAWLAPRPHFLEGPTVSVASVRDAVTGGASVVHLAAHYVSPARPGDALIALGLGPRGEPELLSAAEIASWKAAADVVVLSGCDSAAGEAPPATGLMGLTRAWLAAGARSVVATLWPVPDNTGELFRSFYSNLRAPRGTQPELALRHAQIEALRSGPSRSAPRYWAAYFVVGKD